jgi:hypothetical protein
LGQEERTHTHTLGGKIERIGSSNLQAIAEEVQDSRHSWGHLSILSEEDKPFVLIEVELEEHDHGEEGSSLMAHLDVVVGVVEDNMEEG